MKRIGILWCLLFALYSYSGFSQDISYRKKTIYVDGKPYGYLEKSGTVWARHYSFRNLNKKELITIKPISKKLGKDYDFIYYEVTFIGLNRKTEMQDDNDMARRLAYEFAGFNILKNNKLDPEAVELFLQKYPAKRFSIQSFIAPD